MTIQAGSFVGYSVDDLKAAALVIEVSSNTLDNGVTETMALIALLPTTHVNVDTLFPYGTDPTPVAPAVVSTSTETADTLLPPPPA